jgi:hypothetical protein
MTRCWKFVVGLLTGVTVVATAFLSSVAQTTDTWVIDGIGFKSNFEDRGES